MRGGALVSFQHQSFQATALTITIYLRSPPCKGAPRVKANTVDYHLLLIPFTEVSHLQDKAIPSHAIPPDNPTALLTCTGHCLQVAQAPNSAEQCLLQPSAISHKLQFPSTSTATARTSPWDGCCKMSSTSLVSLQAKGNCMVTLWGPVVLFPHICQTTYNSLPTQHSLQFGHFSATSCSPPINF